MAVSKEDKDKSLDKVLSDIEKQFGKGSIMKLGDNKHMKVDVVSSGCLSLIVICYICIIIFNNTITFITS